MLKSGFLSAVVALAACGRIGYPGLELDDDGPDEVATDGSPPVVIPDGNPVDSVCAPGYVLVTGSAALGTTDFCVMQYETRAWQDLDGDGAVAATEVDDDGCDETCAPNWGFATHIPASVSAGGPWRRMSQVNASLLCRALGPDFDLISNPEWMTIARNAELVNENWSGGAPGAGRIVEGRTNGGGPMYSGITDPSDPYSDTGGDSADDPSVEGWGQRRTVMLDSGSAVWDLGGNVQEWVDWTPGGELDGPPACTGGELPAITCAGLEPDDFNSSAGTYDSTVGIGFLIGGSGTAARRSGQNNDRPPGYAGIFSLNMNRDATDTFGGTSFRCVQRLP
jgi:hypothetical protein